MCTDVFVCNRSAYSVIRRCVHRQTNNQFVVKIIDVARYASNPKLSTEGCLYAVLTNLLTI